MMLTGMFAFANNGNGDTNNSETKPTPTDNQNIAVQPTSEEKTDDEALYCSIKNEKGETVTCWFCNCNDLAKTVLDSGKKSTNSANAN